MGAWVTGHNLAGYLPEADTHAFAEWTDARDSLIADMQEYADVNDEHAYEQLAATAAPEDYPDRENSGYGDDEPSMRATVDVILTDDPPRENVDFSAWVADSDDRRIAFFLAWSPDRDPDDDDD